MKDVVIIGSGVGGLATACLLAKAGYRVQIFEKNNQAGGRAGLLEAEGFRFDTGPSWLLMKDVFEHFFALMGEDMSALLDIKRLSPSYQVVFKDTLLGRTYIHSDLTRDSATFDSLDPGSKRLLLPYVNEASGLYKTAIEKLLYRNYDSWRDLCEPQLLRTLLPLKPWRKLDSHVRETFVNEELQKILTYPALFLGNTPASLPAFYSMLSHIEFTEGVHYPMDGMYSLVEQLVKLAEKHGVQLNLNKPVQKIITKNGKINGVQVGGEIINADIVISNADLYHTEYSLLEAPDRMYSKRYWKKRTLGPSALLMYLGVKGTYAELEHHNLIFSKDWQSHFKSFTARKFPKDPSFYICNPTKTDPSVAPAGHENIFVMVPVAAGLQYDNSKLHEYANQILETIERTLHLANLRKNIVYKKLSCVKDFEAQYNSLMGSALGLNHTFKQTAALRPKNTHKKVQNLYFVGANTAPGVGLPMCLISAELIYKRLSGDRSSGPLKTPIA